MAAILSRPQCVKMSSVKRRDELICALTQLCVVPVRFYVVDKFHIKFHFIILLILSAFIQYELCNLWKHPTKCKLPNGHVKDTYGYDNIQAKYC